MVPHFRVLLFACPYLAWEDRLLKLKIGLKKNDNARDLYYNGEGFICLRETLSIY